MFGSSNFNKKLCNLSLMSSGLSLLLGFPIMHFPQNIFFNNNNERNYSLKWEPESKRKIVLTILTFSFKIKNFSNIDV